jgi:hypothetical protein
MSKQFWFWAPGYVLFTRRFLKSSISCDVTHRRPLVADVSGQPIGPIFKGSETPVTTDVRHVTTQKSEDLIHTAAEAWSRVFGFWTVI